MKNEDYTMGGNDGLRTDSIGTFRYGYGDYLGDMSKFFTRSLAYCPGNIWSARNYTQAWNTYTYQAAQPYGFYFNFTGRPHYIVADPFQMPYQTALELHGYSNPYVPTAAGTAAKLTQMTEQAGLEAKVGQTVYDLQERVVIGKWKDEACLADEPELKKEVEELSQKIENVLKKIKETMENKEKLSSQEVSAKVDALVEVAKPLIEEANTLRDKLVEVKAEYDKKKAEELADKAKEEAEAASDSGDAVGDTSVTTTEGDKKMDTDALATEYGVKKPVIVSDQDVSTVAQELKTHTNNDDDAKDYKTVSEMFSTGKINAGNIVEVLDEYDDYEKLYDGIYEMDNSKEIMTTLLSTLQARVKLLKDNGYITAAEYSDYTKKISNVKKNLGGDAKDIADSEPTIKMTNTSTNTSQNLKLFSKYLKEYVIDKIKGKGTQADFDAKVKAKQKERTTKATADFYKDHATANPGKEVNGTPVLPAAITYLPNSKEFQWKYDSTTIFKGKSYKELQDKVYATKSPSKNQITAKWLEVVKELDKGLKDKPAS